MASVRAVHLDDDPSHPGATGAAPRGRPRRAAAWFAVGAGAAVAALVIGQLALDARDRARVPHGVVAPLPDPRTGAPVAGTIVGIAEVAGTGDERRAVVVTTEADASSGRVVRGVDGADGSPLWSADLRLGDLAAGDIPTSPNPLCRLEGTGADAVVVCLDTDRVEVWAEDGPAVRHPDAPVEVVVLAADDGTQVARWPVTGARTLAVLDGAAVTSARQPDGALRVRAYALDDGDLRWEQVVQAPAGFEGSDDEHAPPVDLHEVDGALAISWSSGFDLVVLTADGERVTVDGDLDAPTLAHADDTAVVLGATTDGGPHTVRQTLDGSAREVVVPGWPVVPTVDDESLADVLLTGDRGLTAWDAGTGDELWTAPFDAPGAPVLLDARVVVLDGPDVVALDGRSGRELWRATPDPATGPLALHSDGSVLHVEVGTGEDGSTVGLVAVGLDGAVGARADLGEGVSDLERVDGRLVAWRVQPGTEAAVASLLL